MIKFKCPHCGKDVSTPDEHAGKKGRCPGCKELFTIPAAGAARPAPSVERRTPTPAATQDDAPPKKKPDYDPDDPAAVEELMRRTGVKVVKRRPDEDDQEAPPKKKPVLGEDDLELIEDEPKKKPARDDDDEAIAEAPRKKRAARDDYDDEDDGRPRKKRGRDEDDDDDEPRARKKRGRDDDEDEDDRPRKRKRKKRRGEYAVCPNCGCRGDAAPVGFTWWGGILGPKLFSHVKCNECGTCYNGKTGEYNTTRIAIYVAVTSAIAIGLVIVAAIANSR
jgi:hypothetical protein